MPAVNVKNAQMMLLFEPKDELIFYGKFDPEDAPTAKIKVTNPTPYSIYYKVKTTASQRYYVTPKMGLLLPYSQEDIVIGMKAPRGNTMDKFKLLAMVSPNTTETTLNKDVWDNFDESQAMMTKWIVVFVDEREQEPELVAERPLAIVKLPPRETIPSFAKILTFIVVGFVAIAGSLYRLGTR